MLSIFVSLALFGLPAQLPGSVHAGLDPVRSNLSDSWGQWISLQVKDCPNRIDIVRALNDRYGDICLPPGIEVSMIFEPHGRIWRGEAKVAYEDGSISESTLTGANCKLLFDDLEDFIASAIGFDEQPDDRFFCSDANPNGVDDIEGSAPEAVEPPALDDEPAPPPTRGQILRKLFFPQRGRGAFDVMIDVGAGFGLAERFAPDPTKEFGTFDLHLSLRLVGPTTLRIPFQYAVAQSPTFDAGVVQLAKVVEHRLNLGLQLCFDRYDLGSKGRFNFEGCVGIRSAFAWQRSRNLALFEDFAHFVFYVSTGAAIGFELGTRGRVIAFFRFQLDLSDWRSRSLLPNDDDGLPPVDSGYYHPSRMFTGAQLGLRIRLGR